MPASIRTTASNTAAAASGGTAPSDGTYYLTQNGTAEKPIVIKGAGDGEAIFDGDGNFNLFNVMAANYNYFEGITIRNTDLAFLAGLKKHHRRKRPHHQEVPHRKCRAARFIPTGPAPRTSTSPTTTSSAASLAIT